MNNRHRKFNKGLTVCALSGTGEIGRNSNYIEYNGKIVVVDAGFSFPDQEMYGIDYLIPNMKYLKQRRNDILAILITHGHLDHIGAIPYIIEDLGFPTIYAGPFAKALMLEKLKEFNLDRKVKIITIDQHKTVNLNPFKVEFITETHSIPDSFCLSIETSGGNVFVSGDYKIDQDPSSGPETDYESLKKLRGRIDIALLESTNAYKEGKAQTETAVSRSLEEIVLEHKGRVVVSAFASLVTRIHAVMEIAKKANRKVAISGRSLHTTLRIAREQRYIDIDSSMIIDERNIKNYPDEKLILLCTGSQGERYAALNRISLGEHKYFKAKKGDLFIMSSSEIPDNVNKIEKMTDRLISQGADLLKNSEADIHASGHGLQEDMRLMYELIRPKYVMPVHGSLTFRYQNKKNYVKWGHDPEKVLLTSDGLQWHFNGHSWRMGTKVESKPILIDGLGVGDTGEIVLKDRRQLAEYGMMAIILNLSQKSKALISKPKFTSRGFVYMKTSKKLIGEIENIVVETHREWMHNSRNSKRFEEKKLIGEIEKRVSRFIMKKTEREPIILPVIV